MDEAEIVTLSPEKVTEPKLRYYFVTTEHKLGDFLLIFDILSLFFQFFTFSYFSNFY